MNDAEVYICTINMKIGYFHLVGAVVFGVDVLDMVLYDQLKASSPRRL